jgi:hypothetical protein
MKTESRFEITEDTPAPHKVYFISSIGLALLVAVTLVSGVIILADL